MYNISTVVSYYKDNLSGINGLTTSDTQLHRTLTGILKYNYLQTDKQIYTQTYHK